MARMRARDWYSKKEDFVQLCSDAVSQARSEKDQEFANEMVGKAKLYGLETFISQAQLGYLCKIADHIVPPRRY